MEQHNPFEKIKMPDIKNIIMVSSGKGGVGKSTVAAGLALSMALEGYAVGLMDADIYGPSVPTLFGINDARAMAVKMEGKDRVEPFFKYGVKVMSFGFFLDRSQAVMWRGPMASNGLKQLINDTNWGKLDYLIIDTPPGTGDIHITLVQQYEITGAIVVTTPQLVALDDVQKAIGMFQNEHVNVPVLGIVENMAWFNPSSHPDDKYYLFGSGGGKVLSEKFNIPLLAQIPIDEHVCENCDNGHLNEVLKNKEIKYGFDRLLNGIHKNKTESQAIIL